ncbi:MULTISPECIES: hypothetical protein [Bacillaceae]|uniref:hypothetical protein n=1 Tax=Bacillaceae TaxID=186817 RepID=UPI00047C1BC1|nr:MULTISPECIES: hypothetical protein [Bacillaceae]UOE95727.1 sodium:proton antiporter [Alkalihalobacillus sp. LMS39]
MISRILSLLSMITSGVVIYKYRYRILNAVLGQRTLRKAAIALSMQIPFVRQKLLSNFVFTQR